MMAEEVVDKKKDEDWMQKKWRPAMGWMYMLVCTLDMAVFPVLWSLVQVLLKQPVTQWQPLTLQGAGLFHLAMGAVLGIAAFGRTQEKIAGTAANAPTPAPAPMSPPSAPNLGNVGNVSPAAIGSLGQYPVSRPVATSPVVELHPDDPPTRNTRND
jgi:hypothetical protein